MKKVRLNDIDLISVIGHNNIENVIVRRRTVISGREQYILLATSLGSTGLHTGILSIAKSNFDIAKIGLFSIERISGSPGWRCSSSESSFEFFIVKRNGVEYVAIKKHDDRSGEPVSLISMIDKSSIFEIANHYDLTEIVPLT